MKSLGGIDDVDFPQRISSPLTARDNLGIIILLKGWLEGSV